LELDAAFHKGIDTQHYTHFLLIKLIRRVSAILKFRWVNTRNWMVFNCAVSIYNLKSQGILRSTKFHHWTLTISWMIAWQLLK